MQQMAMEEYTLALKRAQKEFRELTAAGRNPYPEVLDEILTDQTAFTVRDIGLTDIPADRIIGVKSAGRIAAFTASFRPLLEMKTEFGAKWLTLCRAHLGTTGIQEPILCYEYMGNFYVQEGNKRVSVLRHFDAARIPGNVRRMVPARSEDPRIQAYYEFLDFYQDSRLYAVQFRRPGDYGRLLQHLNRKAGEKWTEEERRNFNAYYYYFQDAFHSLKKDTQGLLCEEALLLWLELYSWQDLGRMSASELKNSLTVLWEGMVSSSRGEAAKLETKAKDEGKANLLERISLPDHLNVAFVHQQSEEDSSWVASHEEGRRHVESVFEDRITVRSYFGEGDPESAKACIQKALDDGAQVVFTTAPPLSRATLKAAVANPRVRFLNCSVSQNYSSIRTYYDRIHEAKFITGAIAGAMAQDDRIGYIASYPLFGVPAAINAFALGAQMTNPRAQIHLRWSCLEGTPQQDLFDDGIRVISNRSVPGNPGMQLDFCNYGTYQLDDMGESIPLGSPVWVWGKFYEFMLRNIFNGGWKADKSDTKAVNYWLGMDSGVIELKLSRRLPEGVRQMAKILRRGVTNGSIDPFRRRIVAQDGTVKNDGSTTFHPEQLIRMDWLCDNVVGSIPAYEELLPEARSLVRELGVYRDKIPPEKEVRFRENIDRIR